MQTKYNRLTIIKRMKDHIQPSGHTKTKFKCLCECGQITFVLRQHLISGHTKSCGCLDTEKKTRHGLYYHPLYKVYAGIKNRCDNKDNPAYKNYGGRGIKCKWKTFEKFYKDMFIGYKKGLQIDRINNNEGYCKSNCRWTTSQINNSNRRDNIKYKKETLAEASRRLGGAATLVSKRLKLGWSIKKAFTAPRDLNKVHAK